MARTGARCIHNGLRTYSFTLAALRLHLQIPGTIRIARKLLHHGIKMAFRTHIQATIRNRMVELGAVQNHAAVLAVEFRTIALAR